MHHPFETLFEKSPFSLEPRFIAGRKLRALSLFRFLPSPFSLPSNGADTTKSDNNTRSNSSWRNDLLSLPFDRQLVESSERFFSRGRIRVDDGKSRVARPNSKLPFPHCSVFQVATKRNARIACLRLLTLHDVSIKLPVPYLVRTIERVRNPFYLWHSLSRLSRKRW